MQFLPSAKAKGDADALYTECVCAFYIVQAVTDQHSLVTIRYMQ